MEYLVLFIALYAWFGFWSAQAGASFPRKYVSWQDRWSFGSEIPEAITASTIATIAVFAWGFSLFWGVVFWPVFVVIAYAGKQSATWAYLRWEGYIKDVVGRNSTTRKANNWIAGLFGWRLGDEGYSWVWAFTKGFITTAPVLFLGAIFQPLGREAASHAEGRLKGDPNFYMEFFGDGFGYAAACTTFVIVLNLLGN
tara:strand:+ start:8296 stop:8886 length:591 start_codon:yes stop_codon:yes gene_type:complete